LTLIFAGLHTLAAMMRFCWRFGVVNNAGAIGIDFTVRNMPVEEWDRLIGTDLRGLFPTTKFALPHMPTKPVGKIINIGSELCRKGRETQAHYCAAKAGINGFTRAFAPRSWAQHLRQHACAWTDRRRPDPGGHDARVDLLHLTTGF
jgi:NAD(P)-dependent dehydrogenase (short-subunit alcohol dehydrogenase family)